MNDPVEEWILRPVRAGMIKAESLVDGTLSIEDIAMYHEALDVENENQARVEEAYRNQRPR
jgi:hypothetical protein